MSIIDTKFVSKSWGYEEWLVNNEKYCGKILFVKRGKNCSWHLHNLKTETFHVLEGRIVLYHSMEDCMFNNEFNKNAAHMTILVPGDSFHIPVGMRHQFSASEDSKIIEISTQHFDDDSYRLVPS